MQVRFTEQLVSRGSRTWRALVATPTEHIRLGSDRLEALRQSPTPSELDGAIVREIAERGDGIRLLVFRAADEEDRGSWAFDSSLHGDDVGELGYQLARSHMQTYRQLVRMGVLLFAHIELGEREIDSCRDGTQRLLAETVADREAGEGTPTADLDVWILQQLTFFSANRYQGLMEKVLPSTLAQLELRRRRVATLSKVLGSKT